MAFSKKTLNTQRPRVDRFVAPRDYYPEMSRKINWNAAGERNDDIWSAKYLQQKKYSNFLDGAFGLEPASKCTKISEPKLEPYVQAWPCVPRKKCFLSSADSILDLPTYGYTAFPELLDWSNDNILVAALGTNYHKWSWKSQSLISQGLTQHEIHCCKYDPRGELLVLGTDRQTVEIHDNVMGKQVDRAYCICMKPPTLQYCAITAVDWSPTGNSFVTGCSRGTLISFSRTARLITWRRVMHGAVLLARVSPDARYVATAAVNSHSVILLLWPSLQMYSRLKSNWTVKSITWHPWRSALLGIGTVSYNYDPRIAMWDAPSSKVQDSTISRKPYSLDAMLFSHRTGELVLSLWSLGFTSLRNECSQLVVLSDPETAVDQWGEGRSGLGRVRTMVFSPDGTKLATATADEDLIIWNFLPEDNKTKHKTKSRRFSAIPVYLDETTYGLSFR